MKKKIFGGIAVVAVAVAVAFNVNLNMSSSFSSRAVFVRLTEIEALAGESTETIKPYKDCTADCPPPVEYKTSRSCPSGSDLENCSASDC
ncbi:MAG: hypothetical protein PHS59_17235 [Paludibacter sp.]|nr:hypothetical protein [Paludibacter sp.]